MNKRYLTITVHIAAWACFFLLPVVFFPRPRDPNYHISDAVIWMLICMNLYLLVFYYFNTEILIPKLLANKKWIWYTLSIIGCLVLYTQLPKLFEDAIRADLPEKFAKHVGKRKRNSMYSPFNGITAVFFLVFTVSTCIKVIQQWLSAEQNKKEIENEKLNTELSFLKSQINPHFLFNTLNNIYSLAIIKSDATAGAVLKLSSIMRYVISDTKQHWVALEKEIQFIQHYIDLQKVRFTEKTTISFIVNGDVNDKQLAPLLFIPFIENAFKYGISTKESSEIIIKIDLTKEKIELFVDNLIVTNEKELLENTGIGLKNSKRRLELLYPDKHILKVEKENNHFTVRLSLFA